MSLTSTEQKWHNFNRNLHYILSIPQVLKKKKWIKIYRDNTKTPNEVPVPGICLLLYHARLRKVIMTSK